MRVLLYSSTSRVRLGGVQAIYARLAAALRLQGHTVFRTWSEPSPEGVTDEGTYPLTLPAMRHGVPIPRTVASACHSLLRLGAGLYRCRPEIVNVHFVRAEAAHFMLLKRLFGYKVVLSVHGSDVLMPAGRSARLLPHLLPEADAITAVTQPVAERVLEYPGVDPAKIRVIPNGVDCDFWTASSPELDVTRRRPMVLSIGRLTPVKGHDVLLKAFAHVRKRVPEASLVLVGDGESRAELESLAKDLSLGDAVMFTGHLPKEEVRTLLGEARVFTLPSRSEGMPLALLEAMSAGVPSVATRVGGVPEVVAPDAGLLVPPEDYTALAAALAHVLLDPDRASALSRTAKSRAKQFPASDSDTAYEKLFLSLLGRS